jgi:hypothetical protein
MTPLLLIARSKTYIKKAGVYCTKSTVMNCPDPKIKQSSIIGIGIGIAIDIGSCRLHKKPIPIPMPIATRSQSSRFSYVTGCATHAHGDSSENSAIDSLLHHSFTKMSGGVADFHAHGCTAWGMDHCFENRSQGRGFAPTGRIWRPVHT